ncbi:hypothetical protein ASE27_04730 [Oerskovia sp. Root918]|nr:hypothetical protein ASE27_04730 [Oerskovia sp. Root918]
MSLILAPSPPVNSWPTTSISLSEKILSAAAQRFSSTSTPGRMRSARTFEPGSRFSTRNSAPSAP